MSLNDNVHQLTRPHLKTAPDGSLRQASALLAELQFWGSYSKCLDMGITPQAQLRARA